MRMTRGSGAISGIAPALAASTESDRLANEYAAAEKALADLAELAAEVAVPEERHPLLEWSGGVAGHLVEPEVGTVREVGLCAADATKLINIKAKV